VSLSRTWHPVLKLAGWDGWKTRTQITRRLCTGTSDGQSLAARPPSGARHDDSRALSPDMGVAPISAGMGVSPMLHLIT
jgi:hypothetical protein